jgi:hypothetical protein
MGKYMILAVLVLLAAAPVFAEIEEPKTGVTFPEMIEEADTTLCCTGVGHMTKFLIKVFGVAHYGAADALPETSASTEERWQHWRETDAAKALVIRFVRGVGAGRMVNGQKDALDKHGYDGPNYDSYVAAYNRDIADGDRLRVIANGKGEIAVYWNDAQAGRWQDPALAAAVWRAWMAQDSTANNPADLVARDPDCGKEGAA